MKLLTAAQMREVDRLTIASGIPAAVLMENAGMRVVEYLLKRFCPLSRHRIVIFCGKGNNGGDGFVIARQLWTRFRLASLDVVATELDESSEPLRMLRAAGCPIGTTLEPRMHAATLVIDALLGTGLAGPAQGRTLEFILAINTGFPGAKVIAVDIPSGMASDSGTSDGEVARADACITFTAPKPAHALPPNCDRIGDWHVGHIGTPKSLLDETNLELTTPETFRHLLAPRISESNKGSYGHVLVVGGAAGKVGAAEMAGLAALRAGAGLVTVACAAERLNTPELMLLPLPSSIHPEARQNIVALGPGLGDKREMVREAVGRCEQAMVFDADALNALAGHAWNAAGRFRVLTPHPGEMARLMQLTVPEVQSKRLEVARKLSQQTGSVVVLKGHRTVIAFPDGRTAINPTGSPAMATGGTGDILTGLTAGLLAQFPNDQATAVLCAVYLHGLAGTLAAEHLGELPVVATDLLHYLPEAMRVCSRVPDEL